jgi:hypothetical protein
MVPAAQLNRASAMSLLQLGFTVSTGVLRTERICKDLAKRSLVWWCMVHPNLQLCCSFIKFKFARSTLHFPNLQVCYLEYLTVQCAELSIHRCSCLLVRVHVVSFVPAFIFREESCARGRRFTRLEDEGRVLMFLLSSSCYPCFSSLESLDVSS